MNTIREGTCNDLKRQIVFNFDLLTLLHLKVNYKVDKTIHVIHDCEPYDTILDLIQWSKLCVELEMLTIGLHSLHTLLYKSCFTQQQQQQQPPPSLPPHPMDEEYLD